MVCVVWTFRLGDDTVQHQRIHAPHIGKPVALGGLFDQEARQFQQAWLHVHHDLVPDLHATRYEHTVLVGFPWQLELGFPPRMPLVDPQQHQLVVIRQGRIRDEMAYAQFQQRLP